MVELTLDERSHQRWWMLFRCQVKILDSKRGICYHVLINQISKLLIIGKENLLWLAGSFFACIYKTKKTCQPRVIKLSVFLSRMVEPNPSYIFDFLVIEFYPAWLTGKIKKRSIFRTKRTESKNESVRLKTCQPWAIKSIRTERTKIF